MSVLRRSELSRMTGTVNVGDVVSVRKSGACPAFTGEITHVEWSPSGGIRFFSVKNAEGDEFHRTMRDLA